MKRIAIVTAVLALVLPATASVRIFVTPASAGYGLTNSSLAFTPTLSTVDADGNNVNAYDFYNGHFVVSAFPPIDSPSGTAASPIDITPPDFGYLWFQFQNEAKSAKVNGLEVTILANGAPATDLNVTYYLQNDLSGDPSKKRWDGTATAPGYPEWHNNPQTLVAITANGLVNSGDDLQMMYKYQTGTNPRTGLGLLGSVTGGTIGQVYEVAITDINYASGTPGTRESTYFRFIPEPASMLLLGLAGLFLRRR